MRIVITGGGTGGHIFPALEIAEEFRKYSECIDVIYVGNNDSLEEKLASKAGFKFFGIKSKKLVGQGLIKQLIALVYVSLSIARCLGFLLKNRPKAVIGVGGFVSAPLLIASFLLAIPRYIAEQNVEPGFTNKALSRIAHKVFLSFAQSARYFPAKKTLLTGNPIRKEFFALKREQPELPLRILVSGGSTGAVFLNEEVPKALAIVKEACPLITVSHQTGSLKLALVAQYYEREHIKAEVVPFIENMPEAFKNHDLLISRAGATVMAEIMACGMPAILVPYRFAGGHQRQNALALSSKGGAKMIEEGENFAWELANTIKALYHHHEDLLLMSHKAQKMATPNAAKHIVKAVLEHNN